MKTRKFWRDILALVVALTLFTGCKKEPDFGTVESSFKPLNSMQIEEIKAAWSGWCPDLTSPKVYYGTHNGYVAIFVSGDLCMVQTSVIADVEISHGFSFHIYLYKDGFVIGLEEAYNCGLVPKAVVAAIAEYHNMPGKSSTFISFFEANFYNIQEVTVTKANTNEVIAQISDTGTIKKMRNMFIGWKYDTAQTEPEDITCDYKVTFTALGGKLEIYFTENSIYCLIDNESYLLPESFHREMMKCINETKR